MMIFINSVIQHRGLESSRHLCFHLPLMPAPSGTNIQTFLWETTSSPFSTVLVGLLGQGWLSPVQGQARTVGITSLYISILGQVEKKKRLEFDSNKAAHQGSPGSCPLDMVKSTIGKSTMHFLPIMCSCKLTRVGFSCI